MYSLRILIVDDHTETLTLLSRLLRGNGHTVLTATSASQAMAVAADNPFDLLLSDLSLPDRSGLDLMREMRQLRSEVRGIALTGMDASEYQAACHEAGFNSYLMKPLDLSRLLNEIATVSAAPATSRSPSADG